MFEHGCAKLVSCTGRHLTSIWETAFNQVAAYNQGGWESGAVYTQGLLTVQSSGGL